MLNIHPARDIWHVVQRNRVNFFRQTEFVFNRIGELFPLIGPG